MCSWTRFFAISAAAKKQEVFMSLDDMELLLGVISKGHSQHHCCASYLLCRQVCHSCYNGPRSVYGGGGASQIDRQRERMCVSVCGRDHSLSSKELHAQQSEDHNEEEEEEQQADDGLHWIKEGDYKVPQWVPVSVRKQQEQMKAACTPSKRNKDEEWHVKNAKRLVNKVN